MNRTLLLLALLVSFTLPTVAQDWTTVPVGTTNDLHALLAATSGFTGYVAGDGGFVASSLDNLTWTPENVGTSADLLSMLQPASDQVWVSGAAGVVRVTQFGVWNVRNIPDASQAYVLSTRGSGAAIAYGSGGSIWRSLDLGQTWTLEHSAGVALHGGYGGILFPGYAVGDGGTILKTEDSGVTWTPKPSGTTADLYAILDGTTLYAVGENGTLLVSTDEGETWSPRLSGTTRTLRAVHAYGNTAIVAVGDDGTVVKSTDQGGRWCRLDPGVAGDLYDVHVAFFGNIIMAVGEGGLFRQTTNGGGACLPAVDATITRVGSGDIPAAGGPLQFRVTLTNPTPESQTFDAWIDAVIPGGSVFGPFEGPQTLTLAPGQTVGPILFTKQVPAQAPAGSYTVRLRVGAYPEALLHDESTFVFAKSATGLRGAEPLAVAAPMTPADWGAGEASFLAVHAGTGGAGGAEALTLASFPNPFRGATTIRFTLPEAGAVRLTVYDAIGREVARLVDEAREAGTHAVAFDASALPAGVYVARLETAGQALTQRVTVIR
jgi:photosystem II stability/assembly factor-like uncharacterized protein